MVEHQVVDVRATGRTPEAVADEVQRILVERQVDGWRLLTVQPIIYNSSTTGYLLLFFIRPAGGVASESLSTGVLTTGLDGG